MSMKYYLELTEHEREIMIDMYKAYVVDRYNFANENRYEQRIFDIARQQASEAYDIINKMESEADVKREQEEI